MAYFAALMRDGRRSKTGTSGPRAVLERLVERMVRRLGWPTAPGLAIAPDLGGVDVAEPEIEVLQEKLHHVGPSSERSGNDERRRVCDLRGDVFRDMSLGSIGLRTSRLAGRFIRRVCQNPTRRGRKPVYVCGGDYTSVIA